jgi:hypothetical protein
MTRTLQSLAEGFAIAVPAANGTISPFRTGLRNLRRRAWRPSTQSAMHDLVPLAGRVNPGTSSHQIDSEGRFGKGSFLNWSKPFVRGQESYYNSAARNYGGPVRDVTVSRSLV